MLGQGTCGCAFTIIHSPHPFHLVPGLQFLSNALSLSHLAGQEFHPLVGGGIDLVKVGNQLAVEQQGGVVCLAVLLQVGMAHSSVLAVPGFLFLREGEVGIVDAVRTQGVGAAHLLE